MFGPVLYDAFRAVKQTFDPDGIFNPGKIVDSPPMTANLRYGAGYRRRDPATYFDYSEYGGMGGAVEMCSGVGACRKTLEGTMCPSYMATREEKHSTRGRANTLRLAMAGRLGESGLGDDGVYDVLDLCLECRACKAECPVGVDVARFKSEFLADYWQPARHAARMRRPSATSTRWREWGSRFAPLSNMIARQRPRPMAEREAARHVDRRRTPPAFVRDTFAKQFARRSHRTQGRTATTALSAVLFNDTFTNYNHPEIGMAAADVLDAAGIGVRLAPHVCCGRPMISQGLLDEARELARRNADALVRRGLARRADPVPRAELPVGGPRGRAGAAARRGCAQGARGRGGLRAVRGSSRTRVRGRNRAPRVEVGPLGGAPPRPLPSEGHGAAAADPGAVVADSVVHGGRSGRGLLRDGRLVRLLESITTTCRSRSASASFCPLRERWRPGSVLVAPGTSCREQVAHFTGVQALHPAQLLQTLHFALTSLPCRLPLREKRRHAFPEILARVAHLDEIGVGSRLEPALHGEPPQHLLRRAQRQRRVGRDLARQLADGAVDLLGRRRCG